MERLVDWLATHVEPYVSFRFVLGLVFSALFFHWLIGNALWLRELARPWPLASPREQRLQRIARSWACVLLLRSISWRNARANVGLIAQIAALGVAAIALSVAVFRLE